MSDNEILERIKEAEHGVKMAEADYAVQRANAKEAKEGVKEAISRLRKLVQEASEERPLFDQGEIDDRSES